MRWIAGAALVDELRRSGQAILIEVARPPLREQVSLARSDAIDVVVVARRELVGNLRARDQ